MQCPKNTDTNQTAHLRSLISISVVRSLGSARVMALHASTILKSIAITYIIAQLHII